jgi:hypothetical protein
MHRRSGVIAALLAVLAAPAAAQAPAKDGEAAERQESAPPAQTPPKPPRPRVVLKPRGGTGSNVGDDASGGGARSAEPSKGGTVGTPSGSFTGAAPKP